MNPFDLPPTGPPAPMHSGDSAHASGPGGPGPNGPGHDGPRRGRMALAALAAAGLVGGGIVVAGQFASANDRPSLDASATVDENTGDENTGDENTGDENTGDENTGDEENRDDRGDGTPSIDGEIVIDDGDGVPHVLDLGELGDCIGPIVRGPLSDIEGRGEGGPLFDDEFHERMERFLEDMVGDELGDLDDALADDGVRIFGSGGSMITIVGPDGVRIIDLGDGDATVTIEQRDGELLIDTDGDATVNELPDLGALLPGVGERGSDERESGELPGELDGLDLDELLPFDLDGLESCLDDLDGSGPSDS